MILNLRAKQLSKPKLNKNLYSTEHWAIYIANKCFDDGYQISNFKLQFLLYFIYKHFKDKGMRIFYDDVKDKDWVCNQGFPKFFSAYYRLAGCGGMSIPFKLTETIDLTSSAFCAEVNDIVKRYRAKDIYVLETLFKESENIKEKDEVVKKRVKTNETEFNYDKEHDLLYVSLKNCPSHYVEQLEDKYFDLWRDAETDEIVGAHIWNASEWFRTILSKAEKRGKDK